MSEKQRSSWMRRTFPGVFGRQDEAGEEDLMAMDQTYEDLQRAEQKLGQWETAVQDRNELLRKAYAEITTLRANIARWKAALGERDTLLTAAYEEIAGKDTAIRELKERVGVVGQKITEGGSPSEVPAGPEATGVTGGEQGEPDGPPEPPQRLAEGAALGIKEPAGSPPVGGTRARRSSRLQPR